MGEEPEIVKILREEERLRNIQTHPSEHNRTDQPEEKPSQDASQDTLLIINPHGTSLNALNTTTLDILYRTIFRTSLVAILVLDVQQRIISWNEYTATLLEMTKEDLHLKSITSIHPHGEWQKIESHLDTHLSSEHQTETKIITKQNVVVDVVVSLYALKNEDGVNLGYLYLVKNISAQKQAEHRFNSLIEYTGDLTCLFDRRYRFLQVNNEFLSQFRCSRDEVIGKPISEFHTPAETKDFIAKLDWVFNNGRPLRDVFDRKGKSFLRMFTPIKESFDSHPTAVLVVSKDVTDNTKVERMLTEQEKKYQIIFEAFPQTILLIDTKGKILDVNKQVNEWLGYKPEEVLETNYLTVPFLTEESRKTVKKNFSNRMLNTHVLPYEIELLCKNNEKRIGLVHTTPIRTEQGKLIAALLVITDTTERMRVDEIVNNTKKTNEVQTLNEDERRLQVVLENSLDIIYQLNVKKGTYEYISPSSVKITGYSADELLSFSHHQIQAMVHPEDVPRWTQHLQIMTQTQKKHKPIQTIEYRIKHKNFGYRWISDSSTALVNEKNQLISVVGTIEDITERKKVWDQLVKSEEKYRILAETSADGVFTTDALGRLTYVNPSFEKLCRRRKSQILATPFRKYLLEDSIYFFQQIFIDARKKDEKIDNVELDLVSEDGEITPIEANIAPLKKDEEFSGVMCTIRDITQRREIEDELKKNERLKTEFMNIAAHELRSPVTPIKGYLDLIIHDNDSNEKIKNWAKISLRNAERLLRLVNDILDVSRLDSDTMRFDMEKIDPVELLNEIVEDMRPAITNKKLELQVKIPTSLPHIIGDKNRLSQVLKNLIGNALKFTDAGSIAVEAERKEGHILITVVDTGIGISTDELKKIFTKFYQAYTGEDRNNEGTGLGLFISKEIVKKHKGMIWAESEVGKGSRFIIQLPYVYKMKVDFNT